LPLATGGEKFLATWKQIAVAILGDFYVCLVFMFIFCKRFSGAVMGKWSQYRVKYHAEWEKEDGFRGELSRCICQIVNVMTRVNNVTSVSFTAVHGLDTNYQLLPEMFSSS